MSDAGLITAIAATGGSVIAAIVGSALSASGKRREDERTRNGVRMGVLEEWVNFERGRQAGIREARDRSGDGK